MTVTYKEYNCKSMLRMHKYVDNWFWTSASVSPYRACEHACNYCDGRSKKYHASEDFGHIVHIKTNAPEILKKELDRTFPRQKSLSYFGSGGSGRDRKLKPTVAVSSGISDAYQPAEKKYGLTRKILELFLDYEVPTHIMTKSDLVLRDLDLLKKINERTWCTVSFSVSTLDRDIARLFEPRASPPQKRMEALGIISAEGILAGITYIPIIPYITDSHEQVKETIKTSKEFGAGYVLAGSMTMRDLQAKRFYKILDEHYPELRDKYKALYWRGYEPDGKYLQELHSRIKAMCNEYDILNYIPRYIPDIELKKNIETSTMLFLISYFLGLGGASGYKIRAFNKLAQTIEDMDENILDIYKAGKLSDIKGIGKTTAKLIDEFLKTGKCEYLEELKG
ncbi:MAG: radical SAM protein [Methanomassiliicoccales archaeon]|nr:MAG: radical SAM protein [Methanomassiliicoccales archaeon]